MTKFRQMRESMGLFRARQQGLNVEEIKDAMQDLRTQYPLAGVREMKNILFHERGLSVTRYNIMDNHY